MEKTVQVMSESTVVPATYQASTVPRRIDLTPWDIVFLLTLPMQYGLLFDSNLVPESLQRLKDSLSRTLDFFYPLAGRLCCIKDVSKEATLFYIECNNAGVEFTHAVAKGVTMSDILQPVYNPSLMSLLFSRNGLLNVDCDSKKPFLAIQVTELTNGGFFLSCTMSHCFGDGRSCWHFFNSWSEICRGCDSPKNPPALERYYPGQTEIWIPNEELTSYKPCDSQPNMYTYKRKIFKISKEKVALLKHKAIEATKNPKISSLQSILSFLYVIISRNRQIGDEDVSIFFMPMDVRTRLMPPLSVYYLGNAVEGGIIIMTGEEIRAIDALKCATSKMHDYVASRSETVIMSSLASKINKPFIFHQAETDNDNKCNITIMTSSPKFDVYGNDFGWGKPTAIRTGGSVNDGMITLFEGADCGSIQVDLSLSVKTFELVEKETEFTSFFQV